MSEGAALMNECTHHSVQFGLLLGLVIFLILQTPFTPLFGYFFSNLPLAWRHLHFLIFCSVGCLDSEAATNPAGRSQVEEAGEWTGETGRLGRWWAGGRLGVASTGLWGSLGRTASTYSPLSPQSSVESEALLSWAGAEAVHKESFWPVLWRQATQPPQHFPPACIPTLGPCCRLCGTFTSSPIPLWFSE